MLTVNREHNAIEPQGLNIDKLPLGLEIVKLQGSCTRWEYYKSLCSFSRGAQHLLPTQAPVKSSRRVLIPNSSKAMKLQTATTMLVIFLASVPFSSAIAVPDAIAGPVLESTDTFHH